MALTLKEEFEEYHKKIKDLPSRTTNDTKLRLYGLQKHAMDGPVTGSRPRIFNLRDRFKWDAWKAVEGTSEEDAMKEFITIMKRSLKEAPTSST